MPDLLQTTAPVMRRVRAFYAPVDRASGTPTIFDPAAMAAFDVEAPPAPWVDLGPCTSFVRTSGTKVDALRTGAPTTVAAQVRTEVEATVALAFESWGRLQLALTGGAQQMNVLAAQADASANGSGGNAAPAFALQDASTATTLVVGRGGPVLQAGDLVVVDVDFNGQPGFVGNGGYVKAARAAAIDVDYVRRVSSNVARVASVSRAAVTLSTALPGGVPSSAMKVSQVVGFCDREGGSFLQQWSALFVVDGEQGDRVIFHYPRLECMEGAAEISAALAPSLERLRLAGRFRALAVTDANDGEAVVCFRTYVPAAGRVV